MPVVTGPLLLLSALDATHIAPVQLLVQVLLLLLTVPLLLLLLLLLWLPR